MKLPHSMVVLERDWLSSNNIVFLEGQSATLVDSGYVGHAAQTVDRVVNALQGRRLARLINTHSHTDHIGGNAALKAAFGCEIAIPAGLERMVGEWDVDALLLTMAGQRADRFQYDALIRPGSEFDMGGMVWQALPAPGHDMEALMYYCAEQGILISGDALWQDGFGIVFGDLMGRDDTLAATRATLEAIGRLNVNIVVPGHGAPFADAEVHSALERAFRRLVGFETDNNRMVRNTIRSCFIFNLLDMQRLHCDALAGYLTSIPFFNAINRRAFGLSEAAFAEWLLADLLKTRSIVVRDGWLAPAGR